MCLYMFDIAPFQFISDFMAGGGLPEYIRKHRDADWLELVGLFPIYVFYPRSLPSSVI